MAAPPRQPATRALAAQMLTAVMKLKRVQIVAKHRHQIDRVYT